MLKWKGLTGTGEVSSGLQGLAASESTPMALSVKLCLSVDSLLWHMFNEFVRSLACLLQKSC